MFVAAEPFDEWLNLLVEDTMGPRVSTSVLNACQLCGSIFDVQFWRVDLYYFGRVRFWVLRGYRSQP